MLRLRHNRSSMPRGAARRRLRAVVGMLQEEAYSMRRVAAALFHVEEEARHHHQQEEVQLNSHQARPRSLFLLLHQLQLQRRRKDAIVLLIAMRAVEGEGGEVQAVGGTDRATTPLRAVGIAVVTEEDVDEDTSVFCIAKGYNKFPQTPNPLCGSAAPSSLRSTLRKPYK